jgi:NADPH:quinone reductase-like Zn-dependent oxidoreductase
LVFISLLSGTKAEINLGAMLRRRLRLIGSTLRLRPVPEKVKIKERFMEQFWSKLVDGTIQPIIDSVYPIEQAEQAHQQMSENKNIGKIVLTIRA